jgi:H+-transporting ATPase
MGDPYSVEVKGDASSSSAGLSSQEAAQRLIRYGPNTVAEEKPHPILSFLREFWAPVPWMLEATVMLELYLGRHVEGLVIGILLAFNAILSFVQESRTQTALAMLRRRLTVQARVLRDGHWQLVPAQNLVPGDVVHLRMGDLVPADVHLVEGQIEMDQSSLTGESAPVEGTTGDDAYAGTVVRRGEATGEVTATGTHTFFGKTAELVRAARTVSHLEGIILSIVRYLVAGDVCLVAAVVLYGMLAGMAWHEILPFGLILLVASVPVALPAMFTLSTALGSSELAGRGVLAARLSAIEEAAAMDVLASDKTGTITQNRLSLSTVSSYSPYTDEEVLRWAALASEEATEDPLDLAILNAARERPLQISSQRLSFAPFDPALKRSEALVREPDGSSLRVVKGAPMTIASLARPGIDLEEDVARLANTGCRVLGVAIGPPEGPLHPAGLLGLQDPPREESAAVIQALNKLGVRVVMVTGDEPLTANAVANRVGIEGLSCSAESLRRRTSPDTLRCNIFAGVLPEDKFHLVQALQSTGHVVGMTGDGVNDAPALRQAEVGIAVANATDVAKAAASIVLVTPGLSKILAAVETSRRIYQRMLTYTLNKIIKTFQVTVFLSLGLVLAKVFVVNPVLIVLLLFANDFVTMSIATDNVSFSPKPDRWQIQTLTMVSLVLAIPLLLLSFGLFYLGRDLLRLPSGQLQTMMFVMLVFSAQCTVYTVRERHHFWHSLPSRWMLLSSAADIAVVSLLATKGILMAAVPFNIVLLTLAATVIYLPLADYLKMFIFGHFRMH